MDDPRDELERTRELLHVVMAQQGEPDAFRWLVDRYEQRLLYFIRRIVDDPDRALDVLQDVWMTVFRRIGGLRAPEAFRVWLYRIAHDKAIDQNRGDRRHKDAIGESIDDSTVDASDDSAWIERIENAESDPSAAGQTDARTPRNRDPAVSWSKWRLPTLPPSSDCSIGTVKSRLHYALRRLQAGIEEHEPCLSQRVKHLPNSWWLRIRRFPTEKYREHRLQLEKALTDASRREYRVRMIVLVLWLLCLIVPLIDPMAGVGLAKGGQLRYPPSVPAGGVPPVDCQHRRDGLVFRQVLAGPAASW